MLLRSSLRRFWCIKAAELKGQWKRLGTLRSSRPTSTWLSPAQAEGTQSPPPRRGASGDAVFSCTCHTPEMLTTGSREAAGAHDRHRWQAAATRALFFLIFHFFLIRSLHKNTEVLVVTLPSCLPVHALCFVHSSHGQRLIYLEGSL